MTCALTMPLLEDYLDNALSEKQTQEVKSHLENCPSCFSEYKNLRDLKELLNQNRSFRPGKDYWDETTSLILAKTVETSDWEQTALNSERQKVVRSNFYRSIVSLAASLFILISAIAIGTSSKQMMVAENRSTDTPVFVVAPIEDLMDSKDSIIMTKAEKINILKGMFMIGPPGMLGRVSTFYEFDELSF